MTTPTSPGPLHRLVGFWHGSMAENMWNDLTPLGRMTIFPILAPIGYVMLVPLFLVLHLFIIMDKFRVFGLLGHLVIGAQRVFFKSESNAQADGPGKE